MQINIPLNISRTDSTIKLQFIIDNKYFKTHCQLNILPNTVEKINNNYLKLSIFKIK